MTIAPEHLEEDREQLRRRAKNYGKWRSENRPAGKFCAAVCGGLLLGGLVVLCSALALFAGLNPCACSAEWRFSQSWSDNDNPACSDPADPDRVCCSGFPASDPNTCSYEKVRGLTYDADAVITLLTISSAALVLFCAYLVAFAWGARRSVLRYIARANEAAAADPELLSPAEALDFMLNLTGRTRYALPLILIPVEVGMMFAAHVERQANGHWGDTVREALITVLVCSLLQLVWLLLIVFRYRP